MLFSKTMALPGWSSVGRWTLFGTLACVVASLVFTAVLFKDLDAELTRRLFVGATVVPTIIGAPLFFFFSLRLRTLTRANLRLNRVARTDGLTACLNRSAFTSRVNDWLAKAPADASGALLMIDADNFKAINDRYGHEHGDAALTIIARAIRSTLRSGDIVGRMGGEEFAVLLPGVNQYQAQIVAERIRLSVIVTCFAPEGQAHPLSVSIGGVAFSAPTNFAELFRIADQHLYGAKHAGRNAVVVASVEDHPIIKLPLSA
ncbi:GGDEF domain-containing protein [uncultured Devosia sp.]|uniref:GGDEF domain-containing protein n=1 Tax=uncultured Devosia sp. TaxID=211434 RepID=UPI002639D8F9|nr:GGDEF domain-containing protein [uncultured Devosia sp.]